MKIQWFMSIKFLTSMPTTPCLRHRAYDTVPTTLCLQHRAYDIVPTTPCLRHYAYDIVPTTSCPLHHAYDTMPKTPCLRHHNILYTIKHIYQYHQAHMVYLINSMPNHLHTP